MIFFLDENMPKSVGLFLQSLNHSTYDVRGTEFEGSTDRDLFTLVQEKQAIFITTDRDFYHTIPMLNPEHYGIIVISLRQPNGRLILEKVQAALPILQTRSLQNSCLLLTDQKMILASRKSSENI
jgi:predicted nuclease of predicted toxin-antitoxin system